jgi:hypothetical protein
MRQPARQTDTPPHEPPTNKHKTHTRNSLLDFIVGASATNITSRLGQVLQTCQQTPPRQARSHSGPHSWPLYGPIYDSKMSGAGWAAVASPPKEAGRKLSTGHKGRLKLNCSPKRGLQFSTRAGNSVLYFYCTQPYPSRSIRIPRRPFSSCSSSGKGRDSGSSVWLATPPVPCNLVWSSARSLHPITP